MGASESVSAIDLRQVRAVTFDCYGTLIDWEAGIRAYVEPLLERAARTGIVVSPGQWIAKWEPIQFAMLSAQEPPRSEQGNDAAPRELPGTGPLSLRSNASKPATAAEAARPWRPYGEILVESFEQTMLQLELESFADGGPGLVRSLPDWPPFPDTQKALRRIAKRRRTGIVSNIDRALLAETLGRLLAPLATLVTAEDAQAYKPDEAPFRMALARLGLAPSEVLHCAFGWKYDLGPARALGFRTCFVNRNGAPAPPGVDADLTVPSLAALADLLDG
jgi:2-haloalkanoic acid dehalogenase type II